MWVCVLLYIFVEHVGKSIRVFFGEEIFLVVPRLA